jgi:hypothetical protein
MMIRVRQPDFRVNIRAVLDRIRQVAHERGWWYVLTATPVRACQFLYRKNTTERNHHTGPHSIAKVDLSFAATDISAQTRYARFFARCLQNL